MSPSQRLSQLPVFWRVASVVITLFHLSHPLTPSPDTTPSPRSHVTTDVTSPHPQLVALALVKRLRGGYFVNCSLNLTRSKTMQWIKSMEYKGTLLHTHSFFYLPFCLFGQPCERDWSFWGLILQLSNVKGFFNWHLWIFLEAITGGHHFQHVSLQLHVGNLPVVGQWATAAADWYYRSPLFTFSTQFVTQLTTAKRSGASKLC